MTNRQGLYGETHGDKTRGSHSSLRLYVISLSSLAGQLIMCVSTLPGYGLILELLSCRNA